jgi:hypothetical protein
MNTIKQFAKYNWNPWIIGGSFILHSSMLYYNETYKGRIIRTNYNINKQIVEPFPPGILIMPGISYLFGGIGLVISICDTYINLQNHIKYDKIDKQS